MKKSILALIAIPLITIAEPTARTCIYLGDIANEALRDSVARNCELIITYDFKRNYVPDIRYDSTLWRRNKPILLMYKGSMTLFDSSSNLYGYDYGREQTIGGGHTIGGFYHFDSLFLGYFPDSINCFLMASDLTKHRDNFGRIKAGSGETWQFRWVMDYANDYWVHFFACTSKVQCLRNCCGPAYDSTYFDGVFIDHILHTPSEYRIYPYRYVIYSKDTLPSFDEDSFQKDIYSFIEKVYVEYHNDATPSCNPQKVLAVGNCNYTYLVDTLLWKMYMEKLDGGMEENFADTGDAVTVEKWKNMVWEMQHNESQGKIFLALKKVADSAAHPYYPFSVTWFDSTQMMYGFATYLMGCDSMSYYSFGKDYQHYYWAPVLDIDLGKPLGPYIMSGDTVAYRYFNRAIVFVNPTKESITAGFIDDTLLLVGPSGNIIDKVGRFTLKHHTGAICLDPRSF